ncbi:fluoride efflux transporter CrcB [Ectothiorhodospiraceae bacterium BW-2]|nr:fluoride efflux transporter CrcB [Ectothiorhodospiraceae bacterium BW-2]
MNWLLLAIGGALGAVARFGLSEAIYGLLGREFPYGTLAVNLIGSLLMGLLYVVISERALFGDEVRLLLMVGFLGALTTFSTFSLDTLLLLQQGALWRAGANVLASVTLTIGALWLAVVAARALLR